MSAVLVTGGTGTLLVQAVGGVDTVVHLASDPRHTTAVDVEGTDRLLEADLGTRTFDAWLAERFGSAGR